VGIECAIRTVVVLSSGPSRKTLRFRVSRGWTGSRTLSKLVNLKPEPVKASGADEDEMQMLADFDYLSSSQSLHFPTVG
jgi:hypothetical protein